MTVDASKAPSSCVLYVDHAGHPAPLAVSYHATASRRLSSSVDKSPPSTITEIDSAYCPQCLSFHDAASAASFGGRCPKAQCRQCPVCTAITSVSIDSSSDGSGLVCMYKCEHCRWTSEECGVKAQVKVADKDGIASATEALAEEVEKWVLIRGKEAQDIFSRMVDVWGKKAQEAERRKRQGDVMLAAPRRTASDDGPEGWSIETLEEATRARKEKAADAVSEAILSKELSCVRLAHSDKGKGDDVAALRSSMLLHVTAGQTSLQAVTSAVTPQSHEDLVPVRVSLRAKKSRRCRAELAAGRPGILVKPKLNPLEGDSSLRSGHGQWWKKDSSAIHVVPKVQVIRHGSDTSSSSSHAFLLMVKNPTLGSVRLRFDKSDVFKNVNETVLEDVMVDSMKRTHGTAVIMRPVTAGLQPTDFIELDAVEDAFLELGKGQNSDPSEVEHWDAVAALASGKVGFQLLSQRNDTAWLQLVVALEEATAKFESINYTAVPVSLQIEVGEGSWESSLIKPAEVAGSELDVVTLQLMIAWKT